MRSWPVLIKESTQTPAPHFKVGEALREAVDSPTKNVDQGQPK